MNIFDLIDDLDIFDDHEILVMHMKMNWFSWKSSKEYNKMIYMQNNET